MRVKGWIDRGVRNIDVEPPPRVHVVEDGRTLCGAPSGPGDVTRDALRSARTRPSICLDCDDVIWHVRRRRKG